MSVCIKASGIKGLTDARYLNALEADTFLGFSFDAMDPAAVTLEQVKAIIQWLHEPAVVAGFGMHQDAAEVSYILDQINATAIQIPAGHSLAVAQPEHTTFVLHVIPDPDLIPAVQFHDRLLHIIDLAAGNISLDQLYVHPKFKDWKALLQQDQVFLKTLPEDCTIENYRVWQPYGWDIAAPLPGNDTDLPDTYGEFLEAISFTNLRG